MEQEILARFPKIRPKLTKEVEQIYHTHYVSNREGTTRASGMAKKMEVWLHKQVARDVISCSENKSTLEIGAGTLNQLNYEPQIGPYDIIEPYEKFYENSKQLEKIRNIYSQIGEIPQENNYDRITAIAAFEHICELPEIIAKAGLMLKKSGNLRVSIPSEGTPLWNIGRTFVTGLEFRLRYGLDYGILMRHEHVNTAKEIEILLRYFFENVQCRVLGINKYFSFYQFYSCTEPNIDKCEKYINQISEKQKQP